MRIEFRFVFLQRRETSYDYDFGIKFPYSYDLVRTYVVGEMPGDVSTSTSVRLTQRWNRLRHWIGWWVNEVRA